MDRNSSRKKTDSRASTEHTPVMPVLNRRSQEICQEIKASLCRGDHRVALSQKTKIKQEEGDVQEEGLLERQQIPWSSCHIPALSHTEL